MRSSSKSRSRNKSSNRNRSVGNIVNRVFDSAGPEGKVRGTPQQIIEKYQTLARDAQLSNDRIAAENFLQHSEHYTRMLNEALREQAERQEAERQASEQRQQRENGHDGQRGQNAAPPEDQSAGQPANGASMMPALNGHDVEDGSALVETPEDAAAAEPAPKKPRARRASSRKKNGEEKPAEGGSSTPSAD